MNNHLLIEPVNKDGFTVTEKQQYQEIGLVVEKPGKLAEVEIGDKVYFDAWLAKKYPKEGKTGEYYWLVKWENVTAVEYAE